MTGRNGSTHAATYRVEVAGKPGFLDAAGAAVLAQLPLIGVQGVHEVRVGRLYELSGPLTLHHMGVAAKELFSDPITQEYRLNGEMAGPAFLLGPHWRVEVWLKPTVSDPAEGSIRRAVADLGLPAPASVRCGVVYKFLGRCPQTHVDKAVSKLLANPLIHRVQVTPP